MTENVRTLTYVGVALASVAIAWFVHAGSQPEEAEAFAKVGSTGLSTGPHLHWELWVNGQNVDPLEWTQRDLP